MMKNKIVLATMVFVLLLSACSAQPTSEIQVEAVNLPETAPSAKVVCWGYDESGKDIKAWTFVPAISGNWEEMSLCESGVLSTSWSNSLVKTDGNWVWSGVISELEKGNQLLGSITCDDGAEQSLYAYKVYDCTNWLASYSGVQISSDPIVFVPNHP